MSTSKWTINILQNHYPERLFKAYVVELLDLSFEHLCDGSTISLDPVTKSKIVMANSKSEKQYKGGAAFRFGSCGGVRGR
jgi:hypothetical protein